MLCYNLLFFIYAAVIKLSSAQVISYVPRNSIPQTTEPARYISNGLQTSNNAVPIARAAAAVPTNVIASNANPAIDNLANINAVNKNAANYVANANYAVNYANVNPNAISIGSSPPNYVIPAVQNAANTVAAANYANVANQNAINALAIDYAASAAIPAAIPNVASVASTNLNNAALANAALANINGNVATFNLGNNGNSFTVTSGSPGAPGFGISLMADALEVGGTVAVNGQIPIFGSVAVNGNVPTDGAATVSYNCGGKQVPTLV